MPSIEIRELRFALIAGAAIGAIFGMLASGPLGASKISSASAVQTATCGPSVCENAVWLRSPVSFDPTLTH